MLTAKNFKKLNDDPLPIEYILDEERGDFVPVFDWEDETYHLDDFVRVHNNPWVDSGEFPDFIHGEHAFEYFVPLYIEVVGDEAVNVYERK